MLSSTGAEASAAARFDQLATSSRQFVEKSQFVEAGACLSQMRSLMYQEMLNQPGFLVAQFQDVAGQRYLAVDKGLHEKLAEMGRRCLEEDDWRGLRRVNLELLSNQLITSASEPDTARLVGLMRSH